MLSKAMDTAVSTYSNSPEILSSENFWKTDPGISHLLSVLKATYRGHLLMIVPLESLIPLKGRGLE